jgi:hypothetical protein
MSLSRPLGVIEFLPVKANPNANKLGLVFPEFGKSSIKVTAAIS